MNAKYSIIGKAICIVDSPERQLSILVHSHTIKSKIVPFIDIKAGQSIRGHAQIRLIGFNVAPSLRSSKIAVVSIILEDILMVNSVIVLHTCKLVSILDCTACIVIKIALASIVGIALDSIV